MLIKSIRNIIGVHSELNCIFLLHVLSNSLDLLRTSLFIALIVLDCRVPVRVELKGIVQGVFPYHCEKAICSSPFYGRRKGDSFIKPWLIIIFGYPKAFINVRLLSCVPLITHCGYFRDSILLEIINVIIINPSFIFRHKHTVLFFLLILLLLVIEVWFIPILSFSFLLSFKLSFLKTKLVLLLIHLPYIHLLPSLMFLEQLLFSHLHL